MALLFVSYFLLKDLVLGLFFPKKTVEPFKFLNKNTVTGIQIDSDSKVINLYKKDKIWFVKPSTATGETKADQERIDNLIFTLSSLVKENVVSFNKKNHQDLGIGKNKIVLKTKDKNYELYIGNTTGTDQNYVRIDNENEVFKASGFAQVFTPFDYRDLNVNFVSDETAITEISINDLVLQKKKDQWFIANKQAKTDRVDFFLSDLKNLKAQDILPADTSLPYSPQLTIKINTNNTLQTAYFFTKDKDNYYLKSSSSYNIFQIPTIYVNSLKKEEKDFIE